MTRRRNVVIAGVVTAVVVGLLGGVPAEHAAAQECGDSCIDGHTLIPADGNAGSSARLVLSTRIGR